MATLILYTLFENVLVKAVVAQTAVLRCKIKFYSYINLFIYFKLIYLYVLYATMMLYLVFVKMCAYIYNINFQIQNFLFFLHSLPKPAVCSVTLIFWLWRTLFTVGEKEKVGDSENAPRPCFFPFGIDLNEKQLMCWIHFSIHHRRG